jgi:hypothetical protein
MRFSQNGSLGKHPGFDVFETRAINFLVAAVQRSEAIGEESKGFMIMDKSSTSAMGGRCSI